MTNIVALKRPSELPEDLPDMLRAMAARIESGEVTQFVCAFVEDGDYDFLFPSSHVDSLTLSTLLQHLCVERMRA